MELVFDHLERLTDERGLFEHALGGEPRPEHGYCLDDVARALVVVCREPRPGPTVQRLAHCYLDFTLAALQSDGNCHNRMNTDGQWTDTPALGDWWGRALWGLGVAAAQVPTRAMRARALLGFRTAARNRSPFLRSMAFAALGAGELLLERAEEVSARSLLRDAVKTIGGHGTGRSTRPNRGVATGAGASTGSGRAGPYEPEMISAWPWPEERLAYGNGSIVEALLLAGVTLPDPAAHALGLELLTFLLRAQTHDGHLSVVPAGGRGTKDAVPGFDQQPIEVAALAGACARAYQLTADPCWLDGVRMAWAWFLGDNDSETPMSDPATGAGFDGLQEVGCNLNQGAESTLAMLSTAQHARSLGVIE